MPGIKKPTEDYVRIKAPADCRCTHCEDLVPRGDEFIWIRDAGAFHPDCAVEGGYVKLADTNAECAVCGEPVGVDEEAKWLRGKGLCHSDCFTGETPKAPEAPPPTKSTIDAPQKIQVPLRAVCVGCPDAIERGETGYWVRGTGMFHPDCYDKLPD